MDSPPKNLNSVIIYSPSSPSKPVSLSLSCVTGKYENILKNVTKEFPFSLISVVWSENTMDVNGYQNCLVTKKSSKYILFLHRFDMRVSKWQNFFFWGGLSLVKKRRRKKILSGVSFETVQIKTFP